MPKSKSSMAKLVARPPAAPIQSGAGLTPKKQFLHRLLKSGSELDHEIIQEVAEAEASKELGAGLSRLRLAKEDSEPVYKSSRDHRAELELRKCTTPPYVKRNKPDADSKAVPFRAWRRTDQFNFVSLLLAFIVALIVAVANPYANLMASGQDVFYERPYLAFLIALIVPLGSLVIKYSANVFIDYRHKKLFIYTVYGLSCVTLLLWSVSFAQQFSGVSGGINWDSLGESGKGSMLTWLQITAELLVAASLALACEDIYQKYNPDGYEANEDYVRLVDELERHNKAHEAIKKEFDEVCAQLAEMEAEYTIFVNHYVAEYAAMRVDHKKAEIYNHIS